MIITTAATLASFRGPASAFAALNHRKNPNKTASSSSPNAIC